MVNKAKLFGKILLNISYLHTLPDWTLLLDFELLHFIFWDVMKFFGKT